MKAYPLRKVYVHSNTLGITVEVYRKGWRTEIPIDLMSPSTQGRLQRALSAMPCVPRFDEIQVILRYYPQEVYDYLRSRNFRFN